LIAKKEKLFFAHLFAKPPKIKQLEIKKLPFMEIAKHFIC
jgi:hypothetical protein